MKKNNLIFLLLFFPFYLMGQLQLNELMINNVSSTMDPGYNYSMWVEFHNTNTSTALSLSNYYLSDDLNQPRKWKMPSQIVTGKGYVLLYLENQSYTTPFKLAPEGGRLYLANLNGNIIDFVNYPSQYRNISYGRLNESSNEWVFFEPATPGKSNQGTFSSYQRCSDPYFTLQGGFYDLKQSFIFDRPPTGETIYYTTDGTEPTRDSKKYIIGVRIQVAKTTIVRARSFSDTKLSSNVVSSTFFIGERHFDLPIISLITDPKNLYDDMIGIYIVGKNGETGRGQNSPVNWNRDWSRPTNFEYFDTLQRIRLNQELDISITGGWTRSNPQKSFKISPRKKFGDNQLRYDFFASKPNRKFKNIMLRNSGNDFGITHFRDAFLQSVIADRMDIDYTAYEPSVVFINGQYWGILNIREKAGKDYPFTNHGLDDDEVIMLEDVDIYSDASYKVLRDYLQKSDMKTSTSYQNVKEMMDIENFISTWIAQIYYHNTDWPQNNNIMWRKDAKSGRWRWILFDTDFGFGLGNFAGNDNTLAWALRDVQENLIFRKLMENPQARATFVDRMIVQLATTFEPNRVGAICDSLAARVCTEMPFHKSRWGLGRSWETDVAQLKNYANNRPAIVLRHLSGQFYGSAPTFSVELGANVSGVSFQLNDEPIKQNPVTFNYFRGEPLKLRAKAPKGYRFSSWESAVGNGGKLISYGSEWRYKDEATIPAPLWYNLNLYDGTWKRGKAQLGYGKKGEVTTIGYGNDEKHKYTAAYFRHSVVIDDLNDVVNPKLTLFVDDGAVIYINGVEFARINMPEGAVDYTTLACTPNDGIRETFEIPIHKLREGKNVIAVEVHQCLPSSSDLIFDAELVCEAIGNIMSSEPVLELILQENRTVTAHFEATTESPHPESWQQVCINEIVAANSKIRDEHGETDDYIELYNGSDTPVNVGGWYLSDAVSTPRLFRLAQNQPELTTIPAKGYLIVWADGSSDQGTLHADFSLSKQGETVTLSCLDEMHELITVDKVKFSALEQDMSYARVPDGGMQWKIQVPTFCTMNSPLDFRIGDVNNDGSVNVGDAVVLVTYLIGNPVASFNIKAADVNGDGILNISDVVGVSNIVLGVTQNTYTLSSAVSGEAICSVEDGKLQISTTTALAGFDFAYTGHILPLTGLNEFEVVNYEKEGIQRVLAYTWSNNLPIGTVQLFAVSSDATFSSLLFVDRHAQPIALREYSITTKEMSKNQSPVVYVDEGCLRMEGLTDGEIYKVITMGGMVVAEGVAHESVIEIALKNRGGYIVEIGKCSNKVIY